MSDTTYCYPPDFKVLRNRFGIRNAHDLEIVEREFVFQRMREVLPRGSFDLSHFQRIHRHLFSDVYEWAGEIRIVQLEKSGSRFIPPRFIASGFADIHRRLTNKNFLKALGVSEFCDEAGIIIGDINHVHPFREDNGRAQLIYLRQLAEAAGHRIELAKIDRHRWIAASKESHFGRYEAMSRCIAQAIVPTL
jgi:cell filamentation protein